MQLKHVTRWLMLCRPHPDQRVVVLRLDPHLVLHGQPGGLFNRQKDQHTDQVSHGPRPTEQDQVWDCQVQWSHVLLQGDFFMSRAYSPVSSGYLYS